MRLLKNAAFQKDLLKNVKHIKGGGYLWFIKNANVITTNNDICLILFRFQGIHILFNRTIESSYVSYIKIINFKGLQL